MSPRPSSCSEGWGSRAACPCPTSPPWPCSATGPAPDRPRVERSPRRRRAQAQARARAHSAHAGRPATRPPVGPARLGAGAVGQAGADSPATSRWGVLVRELRSRRRDAHRDLEPALWPCVTFDAPMMGGRGPAAVRRWQWRWRGRRWRRGRARARARARGLRRRGLDERERRASGAARVLAGLGTRWIRHRLS